MAKRMTNTKTKVTTSRHSSRSGRYQKNKAVSSTKSDVGRRQMRIELAKEKSKASETQLTESGKTKRSAVRSAAVVSSTSNVAAAQYEDAAYSVLNDNDNGDGMTPGARENSNVDKEWL